MIKKLFFGTLFLVSIHTQYVYIKFLFVLGFWYVPSPTSRFRWLKQIALGPLVVHLEQMPAKIDFSSCKNSKHNYSEKYFFLCCYLSGRSFIYCCLIIIFHMYVTQVLDFAWGIVDVALKLFPKVISPLPPSFRPHTSCLRRYASVVESFWLPA